MTSLSAWRTCGMLGRALKVHWGMLRVNLVQHPLICLTRQNRSWISRSCDVALLTNHLYVPRLPCLNSSVTHWAIRQLAPFAAEQQSQLSALFTDNVTSPLLGLVCSWVISESTLWLLCCAGTEAFSHPFLLVSWGLSCSAETASWSLFNSKHVGSSWCFRTTEVSCTVYRIFIGSVLLKIATIVKIVSFLHWISNPALSIPSFL